MLFHWLFGVGSFCAVISLGILIPWVIRTLMASWFQEAADFYQLHTDEQLPLPTKSPLDVKPVPVARLISVASLVAGACILFQAMNPGSSDAVGVFTAYAVVLATLGLIDFDYKLLPDVITYPLIGFGLLASYHGVFIPLDQAMREAAMVLVVGYIAPAVLARLLGKGDVILLGLGDVKLMVAMTAMSGLEVALHALVIAGIAAIPAYLRYLVLKGRSGPMEVAYGPYLAFGGITAMLLSGAII